MYVETPRKWMKNHSWTKNGMFLLCSALYCVGKRGHSCIIRVFFLKEISCFLPSYLINFLLFSIDIYLGSYPKNTVAYFSYILRSVVEYKNRCQVIIFLGPFHSCDIIHWLEDRNCANVALRPVGGWLCHYLGNQS